jgi:lactose/L-arabinose transport system permease protein
MRGYNKYLILFLLPFFILFLTFNILPILYTFFVSFHKVQFSAGGASLSFVGFTNYLQVFNDPLFWTGLRNVLLILGIQVPVMTGLALILALLLNSPLITGKSFFRSIIYFPLTISLVLAAIYWSFMYGKDFGLINLILSRLGFPKIGWLVDPKIALYSIMNVITWRWTGWNMLLFLAGLQSIPKELYEAASIDGAGRLQTTLHIVIPLLKPVLIFSIVLSINGSLQTFAEPWVLTGGGPAYSTYTVVLNIYRYMFSVGNLGLAASMSLVLGAITIVLAVLFIRVVRRE